MKEYNRITLLQDEVINKIAAGEVVERPASILKELVENAVDANATKVTISLEQGGLDLLVITDNGSGIAYEDSSLVLKKHATSKIRSIEDLFSVETMGFRGEALASISAVSRFTLKSHQSKDPTGFCLTVDESHPQSEPKIAPWSEHQGTIVIVKDLFYNIPARQKFLKSSKAELSYCLETIESLSIAYPHVNFVLKNDKKEKFESTSFVFSGSKSNVFPLGEDCLRAKASAVIKDSKSLLYVYKKHDLLEFEALISPPGLEQATGRTIYGFINNRFVKDKVLRYGLMRGYHSHLLKGRFPSAIMMLKIDPSLVDVNVHPAKTEVRLQYSSEIQGVIAQAVREKLREGSWASKDIKIFDSASTVIKIPLAKETAQLVPEKNKAGSTLQSTTAGDPRRSMGAGGEGCSGLETVQLVPEKRFNMQGGLETAQLVPEKRQGGLETAQLVPEVGSANKPLVNRPHINWSSMRFLGSVSKCYWMFEDLDGDLLVVDQHAFHERILYEKWEKHSRSCGSQLLMIPECLQLKKSSLERLRSKESFFNSLGFQFLFLSATSVEIKAVPLLLVNSDLQVLVQEMLEDEIDTQADDFFFKVIALFACRGAIKAGDRITEEMVKVLLEEASNVDFFHNCPHGRRVFRWWKKSEISHWFDR